MIFNFLDSHGIDPAIKVRKNASRKAKGSYARKVEVIAQQTDLEGWKRDKGVRRQVGCRRRVLGHQTHLRRYVSAKKFVNMAKEMTVKISLYNLFMQTMTPQGGG